MMVSGSVDSEMDLVSSNGLMVPGMRVTGKIIELMEKENSLILMATFMMAIGLMIRQMDMVFTII